MHCEHAVIQLSKFDSSTEHINYSPPFQAPLLIDTSPQFYEALKQFADLLDTEEDTFRHTLREGEAVIFDNRRVLHARTEFHEKEGAAVADGETSRWLKGCYLEADDILDRWRVLSARKG
jgi:alpha-ketoglutarate-dependent taurine dioxygenase